MAKASLHLPIHDGICNPVKRDDKKLLAKDLANQLVAEVSVMYEERETQERELRRLRAEVANLKCRRAEMPAEDKASMPGDHNLRAEGLAGEEPTQAVAVEDVGVLNTQWCLSGLRTRPLQVRGAFLTGSSSHMGTDTEVSMDLPSDATSWTPEQHEFRNRIAKSRRPKLPKDPAHPFQRSLGFLRVALESAQFDIFISIAILCSSIVAALEMQYHGMDIGYALGFDGYDHPAQDQWPWASQALFVLDCTAVILFTLELVIRFVVYRCQTLTKPWNWLDIVVVVLSWARFRYGDGTMDPLIARMVRLGRLARVVRTLRITSAGQIFESFLLITKSVTASVSTLGWSVLIVFLVQTLAGMLIGYLVQEFMTDSEKPLADRADVFNYYGTFTRITITMFEVHFANWAPACRVLVDTVGEPVAFVFVAYRCLAGFAILSVVSSVFIQQTMQIAQLDREVMITRKEKEKRNLSRQLLLLFQTLDLSHDGRVSWEEVSCVLHDPKICMWLAALDLDADHLELIFKTLDTDGHELLSPEELVAGALMVKGPAKNLEILRVSANLRTVLLKLEALCSKHGICSARDLSETGREDGQITTSTHDGRIDLSPD